jgi:outer membrane protein
MKKHIAIFLFFSIFYSAGMAQQAWDLQRCIDFAMQNNIAVKQTRLNIDRAEIGYDQSRLDLLPNLNAGATHGYNWGQRIDPFTNQFATNQVRTNNLFLSSSLDLFNGFSKRNNVRQSETDLAASQYDLERIKNDISLQICLAYLQVLLNKENVLVSENQVAITAEQEARMQKLVDAGQEPQGNLFDIQSQLAQEELALVNNKNGVKLSLLNLTQLLQLSREEAQQFDVVKPDLTSAGMELISDEAYDIYLRAKQSMPQIMAADMRRQSAEHALSAARGNYQPSLSLSGSVGSGYSGANRVQVGDGTNLGFVPIGQVVGTNQTVVTLQEQTLLSDADFEVKSFGDQLVDNFNRNLQFNLNIPIFNGAQVRSNVNRAKINQLDADLTYADISNQLRFEIEQAHADAKASLNSYIANDKAVRALAESFKYAEVRFEQGVINAVDFNNIKTQYTNAQSASLQAKYDFVFRTKILDFYLGKPITL